MDCLIIGFNDSSFPDYAKMVASMGTDSGAYRDLNLAFVDYEGQPRRSMDMLNRFYGEGRPAAPPFHNADFLWPVVTYLGSYLARRGHSFDYVNLPHLEREKLREKLEHGDPLTVAITTTLYVSPHPILELISFIREHNRTAKIVVGGPFISNQPKLGDAPALERLFQYLGADIYVISQEGEAALVNLIRALKGGTSLGAVENIAYRQGDGYVLTPASPESNPLEENMVDYGLFSPAEVGEFVTLRTAKSCPFSCSFCGFPQRAGKYKYLSVELVEQELNAIREIGGVTTLTFIDDTFNVPKERFREMLRMMIRNDYGFKWNSFYRSDHGDERTIELMGEAGCEGVFLGVESGSDRMLERMNKTARRKHYLKAIPLLKAAGISTHANVIVGFPGETFETFEETVGLIEETGPDFFRAQLWYADPVTPIWERRDEYGVKGSAFAWSHDTMDYHTACDLVDKMFLSVRNSVWLPQNGFEQWSTFYLQRKGMSVGQIKTFLRCFNAAVREKLLFPHKPEIDPALLESLRRSAQFDRGAEPDVRPVALYTGYHDAERFVLEEFAGARPAPNVELISDGAASAPAAASNAKRASLSWEAESAGLEAVADEAGADLSDVVLAAYGLLLSRVSGRREATLAAATAGEGRRGATPLRVRPPSDASFAEFARALRLRRREGLRHWPYAFYILTSPTLMAERGAACPVFDAGFLWRDSQEMAAAGIEEELKWSGPVSEGLSLVLEAAASGDRLELAFVYREGLLREETVEGLRDHLNSILRAAAASRASLKELAVEKSAGEAQSVIEAHASEVFNF
ncbi:MAG TPA: PhpK family radical SAM P-methyltransferase [Pyrinomonadaceae bacterium]|jgi:radical SAM PhpK family P-methyltransferase